jgi:hypothetical protein
MSNLTSALQQLREEHKQAQQKAEKLQSAISVIQALVGRNGSGATRDGARPGRIVSAAARSAWHWLKKRDGRRLGRNRSQQESL